MKKQLQKKYYVIFNVCTNTNKMRYKSRKKATSFFTISYKNNAKIINKY